MRETTTRSLKLLDVVRRKAERALEDEVCLAVFFSDPRRDDVSLKKLRDFFEDFRRDLRDIEFVNQGAGDLIERGLPLESKRCESSISREPVAGVLHGSAACAGREGRFRRRASDTRSREALLNGKLTWTHESLSLLSRPMSMYESVITSAIP